jgi:hypothetical protein
MSSEKERKKEMEKARADAASFWSSMLTSGTESVAAPQKKAPARKRFATMGRSSQQHDMSKQQKQNSASNLPSPPSSLTVVGTGSSGSSSSSSYSVTSRGSNAAAALLESQRDELSTKQTFVKVSVPSIKIMKTIALSLHTSRQQFYALLAPKLTHKASTGSDVFDGWLLRPVPPAMALADFNEISRAIEPVQSDESPLARLVLAFDGRFDARSPPPHFVFTAGNDARFATIDAIVNSKKETDQLLDVISGLCSASEGVEVPAAALAALAVDIGVDVDVDIDIDIDIAANIHELVAVAGTAEEAQASTFWATLTQKPPARAAAAPAPIAAAPAAKLPPPIAASQTVSAKKTLPKSSASFHAPAGASAAAAAGPSPPRHARSKSSSTPNDWAFLEQGDKKQESTTLSPATARPHLQQQQQLAAAAAVAQLQQQQQQPAVRQKMDRQLVERPKAAEQATPDGVPALRVAMRLGNAGSPRSLSPRRVQPRQVPASAPSPEAKPATPPGSPVGVAPSRTPPPSPKAAAAAPRADAPNVLVDTLGKLKEAMAVVLSVTAVEDVINASKVAIPILRAGTERASTELERRVLAAMSQHIKGLVAALQQFSAQRSADSMAAVKTAAAKLQQAAHITLSHVAKLRGAAKQESERAQQEKETQRAAQQEQEREQERQQNQREEHERQQRAKEVAAAVPALARSLSTSSSPRAAAAQPVAAAAMLSAAAASERSTATPPPSPRVDSSAELEQLRRQTQVQAIEIERLTKLLSVYQTGGEPRTPEAGKTLLGQIAQHHSRNDIIMWLATMGD